MRADHFGNIIVILCVLAFLVFLAVPRTDAARTMTTLQNAGYSDIETTGHRYFACGQDDWYTTTFTAINPIGRSVEGVVCCGMLKDCTVRF